jgi:hypothetical protein
LFQHGYDEWHDSIRTEIRQLISIPSMLGMVGIGLALDTFDAMVGILIELVVMAPKAAGIVVIVVDSIEIDLRGQIDIWRSQRMKE